MSTTLKSGDATKADRLSKAAACTLSWPFKVWGFGEGIALRGLREAYRASGNSQYDGFACAFLRSYVVRGVARSNEEHIAPGTELLLLYEESGETDLLAAAEKLAALNASFPANSFGAKMHRPDLPGWRKQIWVDCLDVDPPFLVRLGRITGNEAYIEQGLTQILAYTRALQVEASGETEGLFWHGHEMDCGTNGQLWARGNAWAIMGLVETLKLLPASCDARPELLQRLQRLCRALKRHQHAGGLWHTVIPNTETYLESTLAAMAAFALREAFAADLLDRNEFREMERLARSAALNCVDDKGALGLVSDATPIGELKMYATRPFGIFPWGQGPLLLMLSQDFL